MQWAKVVAVVTGIVLLLSTTTALNTFAQDIRNPIYVSKQKPVSLSLEMEGCTNDKTCGATFLVGDTVTFRGKLTTMDNKPVPGAIVNIVHLLSTPALVTIASAVTGTDGKFELMWTAQFTPVEKATTDVTKKFLKETVVFFAQYDGDDKYTGTRTGKQTATIMANQIFTTMNAEKRVYSPGQSALIFLGFIDSKDLFVDPDSIRVMYDDQQLKVEKKKDGSYTVVTPSLTVDHHQVIVIPKKEGYNIETGYLTVQVSGFFGKV